MTATSLAARLVADLHKKRPDLASPSCKCATCQAVQNGTRQPVRP